MANFKPAAGSHNVNSLFLAFLKKQHDTSGTKPIEEQPKDIETEPTSREKRDGDTEKGINKLTKKSRERRRDTGTSRFYRRRF